MMPNDGLDAHPNVIVNVMDHDKTFVMHHTSEGVAKTLKYLAPITHPKQAHVHALPLQSQQIILNRADLYMPECTAYIYLV